MYDGTHGNIILLRSHKRFWSCTNFHDQLCFSRTAFQNVEISAGLFRFSMIRTNPVDRAVFVWLANRTRIKFLKFWLVMRTISERVCHLIGFWNMFIWRRVLIIICRANKILFTAYKVAFQQTVNKQLQFVCPFIAVLLHYLSCHGQTQQNVIM